MLVVVFVLLFTANVFGQAALGNEKFDQKQYVDAANAYEKIPAAQRDTGIYNRLGMSYHLSNQLRAAENAYKASVRVDANNANATRDLIDMTVRIPL